MSVRKRAAVLDPKRHHELSQEVLAIVQKMIASGLLWVFVAMALLAAIQWGMTLLMSHRIAHGEIERIEPGAAMEAVGG